MMVRAVGVDPTRALRIFMPSAAFAAPVSLERILGLRSGLSLRHSPSRRSFRRRPSSLYTFPASFRRRAWLGITTKTSESSPNLGGSAPPVSRRALKLFSSPLRMPFRHARTIYEVAQRLTRSDF
jgi:hypothetical protein